MSDLIDLKLGNRTYLICSFNAMLLGVTYMRIIFFTKTYIWPGFAGDKCEADNKAGVCSLLATCKPLLDEIKRSGNPMPVNLRRKLQSLMCGFESDHPIVSR